MEKRKVKNGNVYIIEAHLQKFDNQSPYFSVTHEVWHATKKGEINKRYKEPWCCGACGEDVEKAFPELKDLLEFHLRDINGEPMYVILNTMYYQRRRKTPSFSYGDISRVLRSPRRAEGGQYFC